MVKKIFKWLSIFLLSASLYGQEAENQVVEVPNPVHLQPNWWQYFQGDRQELEKRIEKALSELRSLVAGVEDSEEKVEAEGYLKEIAAHLNTLARLRERKVEPAFAAWVPKGSYSLQSYFHVADKVVELENNGAALGLERRKLEGFTSEISQELSNEFSQYIRYGDVSKEKFLKGLQLIALRTRLLYLDEEKRFVEERAKRNRLLLARYRDELEKIPDKLEVTVDQNQVEEALATLKAKRRAAHRSLIEVEAGVEEGGQLVNQRLLHALIEKSLIDSEQAFLEAKGALYKVREKVDGVGEEIERIRDFYYEEKKQLEGWREATAQEFEQVSASLIAENGSADEEKYQKQLQLTLSNKALLNELSKELLHIELLIDLIDFYAVKEESFFEKATYQISAFWGSLAQTFEEWFSFALFEISGIPVTMMGIIKATIILIVSIWASKLIRAAIFYLYRKKKVSEQGSYVMGRMAQYGIICLGIILAFGSLGFTGSNLAIILGALGIGIGFGLQSVVNNFICGLTILFEKNVRIGDLIELESGHFGRITGVSVQNTIVHTFDGIDVIVPNSSIVGNKVINWTKKDPYQRLHIPFGVAYGTDQDKVSEVVREAALEVPCTLTSENGVKDPELWLVKFGDSSLDFELIVWVNIYRFSGRSSMKAAYLSAIEKAFKKHGVQIPFPQRDLHLKDGYDKREFKEKL